MRILFIAPYTPLLTKPRPYNFIMHLAKQHEAIPDMFRRFTSERTGTTSGLPRIKVTL